MVSVERFALAFVAGLAVASLGTPAAAQDNIDAGKSAAQMFHDTCAQCHRRPQELRRTSAGFLRQHYTAGSAEAAAMAAYLSKLGRDPRAVERARAHAKSGREHAKIEREQGNSHLERTKIRRERTRVERPKVEHAKVEHAKTEHPKIEHARSEHSKTQRVIPKREQAASGEGRTSETSKPNAAAKLPQSAAGTRPWYRPARGSSEHRPLIPFDE